MKCPAGAMTLLLVFLTSVGITPLGGEEIKLRHWKGYEDLLSGNTEKSVILTLNNTQIEAHKGTTVSLPCTVNMEYRFGVITWARLEDDTNPYTVLTIGDTDITSNSRITLQQQDRKDEWNLLIKSVKSEDSGYYECQVTTYPPQSIIVHLEVLDAYADIVGAKEKVIKAGSTLKLVCQLRKVTSRPDVIFWFHNSRMINYDLDAEMKVTEDTNGSTLTISSVRPSHSGNYSCEPSHLRPDSVTVTILAESKSANALQDKQASKAVPRICLSWLLTSATVGHALISAVLQFTDVHLRSFTGF